MEESLIRAALDNPADSAPWYAYCDWLRDADRDVEADVIRRVTSGIATVCKIGPVWANFTDELYRWPLEYDSLSAGILDALACAARLGAGRVIQARCECGRPLEPTWQVCAVCVVEGEPND